MRDADLDSAIPSGASYACFFGLSSSAIGLTSELSRSGFNLIIWSFAGPFFAIQWAELLPRNDKRCRLIVTFLPQVGLFELRDQVFAPLANGRDRIIRNH